ncbi:fumarylacetoacetate hydrolase family protein [Alkalihalobacillus trypoxylicola]|uniref:5-carboxymethyl-2-hydroxymuconate isomerase n=1 Tax=Alkalihalobacillus trypoxylicola TaxID=519424 RepID=A0A162CX54_9BACI|nr:fumarylacetoacetate hydrolase family protein [Alkalihalobacillus trypoxylicola]KYG26994.1 5-carboxymethyl-2-hydroxymuconate isomerase [Alkalihalobacillus trypoxylicola]
MKLLNFNKKGQQAFGVKKDGSIIDIEEALKVHKRDQISTNLLDLISSGKEGLFAFENFLAELPMQDEYLLKEEDIQWEPCLTRPSKIICVGLNYRKHADETDSPYPKVPILFNKFNNTLTGHLCEIEIPNVTNELDYEVELGVVIGKKAKNVKQKDALDYIFGYCTANDLSARDLQMKTPQWLLGKSCDDFSPIGPYLVTADEVGNPNQLQLKTYVNGEIRQDSNTSDMIFSVDEVVSYISTYMTLMPGDIILTGTPEGVVLGYPKEKQIYIKPGDEVTVEIEKVGKLTNVFKEEKLWRESDENR